MSFSYQPTNKKRQANTIQMKAKCIKGNSPAEILSSLEESLNDGFKPTLAIVFLSINQDRTAVCRILNNAGLDILGATSCGEFINDYQGCFIYSKNDINV